MSATVPTILFLIASSTGLILTIAYYGRKKSQGNLTRHQKALILAIGLGLTWLLSFYAPLLVSRIDTGIEFSLTILIVGVSLLVFLLTYIIVRIMLYLGWKN